MASQEEIKEIRLKKIQRLKDLGIDPYPSHVHRDLTLEEVKDTFETLEQSSASKSVAGRVMTIRGQGAILFVVLNDGTSDFQIVLKKDVLGESSLQNFVDLVDMGDFLSFTGTFFITQRGEKSMLATSWEMGSKSLLALPEKWHGLVDIDERFRKRYLDILSDPEIKRTLELKSKFWDATRNFLKSKGFLEVETPTLEITTGGAEANPFKTHLDDFDLPVYLRISVGELWQKRLMAAGFPKTFEIGRVYRNEGSSPDHLQEFVNMEFYWAYANYVNGMELVEEMYRTIAKEVFGKTEFTTRGHTFDIASEWKKIDYTQEILEKTGIDILKAGEEEMKQKLEELQVKYSGDNKERLVDTLWKYCRKSISGPAFLINHPKLVSPLAKAKKDNPDLTERFQVILAGSEVGNGFSELNDPIDQRERFENQQKLLAEGDSEAMMPEWDFVEMLEHGMPPTCGFGFGERLFGFLVDKPLREVQFFPLMKPRE